MFVSSPQMETVIPHGPQNRRFYLQKGVQSPDEKAASTRWTDFKGLWVPLFKNLSFPIVTASLLLIFCMFT